MALNHPPSLPLHHEARQQSEEMRSDFRNWVDHLLNNHTHWALNVTAAWQDTLNQIIHMVHTLLDENVDGLEYGMITTYYESLIHDARFLLGNLRQQVAADFPFLRDHPMWRNATVQLNDTWNSYHAHWNRSHNRSAA